MLAPWCLSIVCLVPLVAGPGDVPSTRILHPEQQRDFYRGGGRDLLGQEIQLKIESKLLRKPPLEVTARRGGKLLIFENRSVPIVIPECSAYWRQARRHVEDADGFILKGRLCVRPADPRQRVHLYVTRIKRAHGEW